MVKYCRLGESESCIETTERSLEKLLRIDNGTWQTTLFNSADVAREDLQWLRDEPAEVIRK